MKQTTKMSRAVGELEKIYNSTNADFFQGELPTPIITVQSKPGTFGHCSVAKAWKKKDAHAYELNIAAEVLDYPIEEIIDTILHEQTHIYCREHDIKEVSRGGVYHNGRFKAIAEAHGLTCYREGANGWNTSPGDNLVEYALQKGWSEIQICRTAFPPLIRIGAAGTPQGTVAAPEGGRRPSSTRKLVCPRCGQTARVTCADHAVGCWRCMVQMVEA